MTANGAKVRVTIDIESTDLAKLDPDQVSALKENLTILGFTGRSACAPPYHCHQSRLRKIGDMRRMSDPPARRVLTLRNDTVWVGEAFPLGEVPS